MSSWLQSVSQGAHEVAVALVGVVIATAVAFKKLSRSAADDNKAIAKDVATTEVIELMRKEINRLAQQNTVLVAKVNKLQLQVMELQGQLNASQANISHAKRG